MTQMTESQMVAHIKSTDWNSIKTIKAATEEYCCNVGLFRAMFGVNDPEQIKVLSSNKKLEVWAKDNKTWENCYCVKF